MRCVELRGQRFEALLEALHLGIRRPPAGQQGVDVAIQLHEQLPQVVVDSGRLLQLLVELG